MADTRPNVIFIICHDLGRHLGCYGVPVESPNLDRFAAEGVRFANCFTNSAACSPARGCIMSGQYAHTNGLMGLVNTGWSLPQETLTIVDYLNDAGYETVHFGLQHERYAPKANRYAIERNTRGDDIHTENAVDQAIDYLKENAGREQPFYMNVGTVEVHGSQWQSKPHTERWQAYTFDPEDQAYVPPYVPDRPQIRREYARFQGAIRLLDIHVQRLFEAIAEYGYRENTLVVFTTDHGIAAPRAKSSLYDEGMGVTLLMQMPGTIGEGVVVDDMIQNIDHLPTLLEAAGVDIPPGVQGRSYWKRLTGQPYEPHDMIFLERNYHQGAPPRQPVPAEPHPGYDPIRAARTSDFLYIRNFDENAKRYWLPEEIEDMDDTYEAWYDDMWPERTAPRDREELYSIADDPRQWRNLAGDPAYREVKEKMAARLDAWMRETDDPLLNGPIPDRLNGWPEEAMNR